MTWPELVTERTAPAGLAAGGDLDVPGGDVVPDGVVDQVGDQLLDQEGVAVEGGGLEAGLDVQGEAAIAGRAAPRAALAIAARSAGWRSSRPACCWPG